MAWEFADPTAADLVGVAASPAPGPTGTSALRIIDRVDPDPGAAGDLAALSRFLVDRTR